MNRRIVLCVLFIFASCRGERTPPVTAGAGVTVEETGTIRVDPGTVPVLESCAVGQIVRRGQNGWECAEEAQIAESALSAKLSRLEAEAARISGELEQVEARARGAAEDVANVQENLEAKIGADQALPFAISTLACVPSQETVSAGTMTTGLGKVYFRENITGRIVLYCPVIATNPTQRWNAWTLRYTDGDGSAPLGTIVARLQSISPDGALTEIAELSSSANNARTETEVRESLSHTFDFDARYYFVEIQLERTDRMLPVEVFGIRVGS